MRGTRTRGTKRLLLVLLGLLSLGLLSLGLSGGRGVVLGVLLLVDLRQNRSLASRTSLDSNRRKRTFWKREREACWVSETFSLICAAVMPEASP